MTWITPQGGTLPPALKQGGLDGLCGLYAAINAIRLVTPMRPLGAARTASLFTHGAEWLQAHDLLLSAVTDGMDEDAQYALTQCLAEKAGMMIGAPLSVLRPIEPTEMFQRRRLLAALDAGLAQQCALIVCLSVTYNHFTVISGRTNLRYYLHDSGRMTWIARRSLGVLAAASSKRHQVSRVGIVQVGLRE